MKEIQLTQGKVALVDDEDFEYLNQWKWYANNIRGNFYATRAITVSKCKQKNIYMHRLIMKPEKENVIDHINGNTIDNRKSNLRICTISENTKNRQIQKNNKSGFKGVRYNEKLNKYRAEIYSNRKYYNLGYYIDPKDAARAYNAAAIKYHGEFANLNKID